MYALPVRAMLADSVTSSCRDVPPAAVKLWDGLKGTFVATFRGHVGPVYQVRLVPGPLLGVACSVG